MPVIFPLPNDPLVAPYIDPIGRMMLAYGRAMVVVREIAIVIKKDEAKADKFMRGVKSHNLVKEITKLCEPTLTPDRLDDLRGYCETLVRLYARRNLIVHGEWWFDLLSDGGLRVRDWDRGSEEATYEEGITPEAISQLAHDFVEVSLDLDMFTYPPPQ